MSKISGEVSASVDADECGEAVMVVTSSEFPGPNAVNRNFIKWNAVSNMLMQVTISMASEFLLLANGALGDKVNAVFLE